MEQTNEQNEKEREEQELEKNMGSDRSAKQLGDFGE